MGLDSVAQVDSRCDLGAYQLVASPESFESELQAEALRSDLREHETAARNVALLHRLAEAYPDKRRIHLILDNYVIHKSKKTQRALASFGDKFALHFLRPYCPNDNKIERLWKDLHDNVTRNHRCGSIEELMEKVETWLDRPPDGRTGAGLAA